MRFASSKDRSVGDLNTQYVTNIGTRLKDSLVSFDCLTHDVVEAGDHDIFIGRVTAFQQWRDCEALGFAKGQFCTVPGTQEATG